MEGIEFLEFVDEPGSAAPFRAMLQALGFRRTHRHRSKDVELHSQGDIRIVLNLEDEGFAHSFQLLHGLSVAAIALRVDDATAAVDRADSLLGKHFRGPIGQGELELPAVRGVGGSLLYFIDQKLGPAAFQEVDFLPDPADPSPPDLGLTTIDHLAQVVPQTEFLSWLLYYRAILGLEPDARTDLADPRGLIVSRALTNPARTLRLPLNASQAQASAAGRFMERTAGAGAQHIAFACTDLAAAAAALPPAIRLPVPENYYEDLEARFGLPPTSSTPCAPTPSSTTASAPASSSTSSPAASTASSSSSSNAAAATTATAKPTPPSASPPRPCWIRRRRRR